MKYDPDRKVIFIVDDNDLHVMYLDYYLGRDNEIEVVPFESGETCLENLARNPDVIILDYYLSGINGLKTLQAIKQLKPEIPVAVVTGQIDAEIAAALLENGAFKYVQKNHESMQELVTSIDQLLDQSQG